MDRHPLAVDPADVGQMLGCRDDVLNIDHAPLALQALPIGASIARGAAVIDVDHREPTARPVLDRKVEGA